MSVKDNSPRLPLRAVTRDSVLAEQILALLPAVGQPRFAYSQERRCFILEFLRLEREGDKSPAQVVSIRIRFVPARLDLFGLLGYLTLVLATPLGLFLAISTHDRATSLSGVVIAILALLTLLSRPRIIRPDLRLLSEIVQSERQHAGRPPTAVDSGPGPDGASGSVSVPEQGAGSAAQNLAAPDEQFHGPQARVTPATKLISGLIGSAGGIGALWAAAEAYLNPSRPGLQIALVAVAAGLFITAAVSSALLVSADVRAHAAAATARDNAGRRVAAAYAVRSAAQTRQPGDEAWPPDGGNTAPVTAVPDNLLITLMTLAISGRQIRARVAEGGEFLYVTGLRRSDANLMVRLSASSKASLTDTWHGLGAITEFDVTAEFPGNDQPAR